MNLFLNDEHRNKFNHLRKVLALHYQDNKEYLSVVFLMAADQEFYDRVAPYFDGINGLFEFSKMFEEKDFSSGYYVLAKLAVNLFNDGEKVTPLDLISTLDSNLFQLAINAIYVRRQGVPNK